MNRTKDSIDLLFKHEHFEHCERFEHCVFCFVHHQLCNRQSFRCVLGKSWQEGLWQEPHRFFALVCFVLVRVAWFVNVANVANLRIGNESIH